MMRSRFYLVPLLLVVVAVAHVRASVLVVLGTHDRIVVAADSRLAHYTSPDKPPDGYVDSGCKIVLGDHALLAAAGNMAGTIAGTHGLDLRAVWKRLGDRLEEGVTERAARLAATLRKMRLDVPFETSTELAVIGFAGGVPASVTFTVRAIPGRRSADVSAPTYVSRDPLVSWLFYTGSVPQGLVDRRLRQQISEDEMVALAQQLVDEQSHLTSATVGGAIDIAVIDAKAVRWVQVKDACR